MTCVVIEDESLPASILEDYIRDVSFLDLKAVCRDAIAALDVLKTSPVDLLFLDIHLPRLKGLDFLRTTNYTGQVIITSAYHQYALEGYDFGIVDYLLKPISFERFVKSVHKAREFFTYKRLYNNPGDHIQRSKDEETIFFKSGTLIYKVDVNDITYLEKKGNYFVLHTKTGKKILIRTNFADLIEKLPVKRFFRVHKSYIVSLRHIETIDHNYISVNKERIPISDSFKDEFMKII